MTPAYKRTGAINDLTIATEFLMVALREITAGAAPRDRKVQEWVQMAVMKLGPVAGGAA